MKLLYLSAENLRNTMFIKDLVYHLKGAGKCVIIHDHFGSVPDTRFVTKRISALLSEELIANNAFSGDQRRLLQRHEGDVHAVQAAFVMERLQIVDMVVLNAIGVGPTGEVEQLSPAAWIDVLRREASVERVLVFSKNARSPLTAQPRLVDAPADVAPLREAYAEEALAMDNAVAFAPSMLVAPGNFKQALAGQA